MKTLAVAVASFALGLTALTVFANKPEPFHLVSSGPVSGYNYQYAGTTSTLGTCTDDRENPLCIPCFGEDGNNHDFYAGDLDGTYVTLPRIFCSWGGSGMVITASTAPRLDLTITANGVPARDLGTVDRKHRYMLCLWPGDPLFPRSPDIPWAVTITGEGRNVALTVDIMPDAEQHKAQCPDGMN